MTDREIVDLIDDYCTYDKDGTINGVKGDSPKEIVEYYNLLVQRIEGRKKRGEK